jgi:hypothetical protein
MFRNLASKSVIFGRTRFFYMPQSWDMGQIILLHLRRKVCCGGKIRRLRLGANPRSCVPEASMQNPRPLKPPKPRRRCENNIKIDIQEIEAVRWRGPD